MPDKLPQYQTMSEDLSERALEALTSRKRVHFPKMASRCFLLTAYECRHQNIEGKSLCGKCPIFAADLNLVWEKVATLTEGEKRTMELIKSTDGTRDGFEVKVNHRRLKMVGDNGQITFEVSYS